MEKIADFFKVISAQEKKVRCELCPHYCLLTDGKRGICLSRKNIDGKLYTLNYFRPVSIAVDPIEKKPLYHFYPGSYIFSTGPNGCTLKCIFCQNNEISQEILPTQQYSKEKMLKLLSRENSIGIAYTYSEPYIWYETIIELGKDVRDMGLKNVMVTNGFFNLEPLKNLLEYIDAMNIDIKSIKDSFYKKLCKARLEPVLKTCEIVKKHCHLEITNLLIPHENDSLEEIEKLVDYIAKNLGKDTPLHFSRYFPRHKMKTPPTDLKILESAYKIAKEKLDYVYIGNVDIQIGSNTYCPKCGEMLIERYGYNINVNSNIKKNASNYVICPKCGNTTNIIM
jgi:pyruvate formate lyase activating enzyme